MSESRAARPWLWPLLLLAFSFAVYGWTLALPWSFFDDTPYFLIQARETLQHCATGDYMQAIDSLMRWEENNLGPAVRIYVHVQWIVFGKWSASWHFVKILTFFLTIWGMREFVRELKGATAAQVVAILSFTFFSASSFHPDFQTHFINFARLLTTDSIMTPVALWAAVLALRMTPSSSSRQRVLLALCVAWCALTKATAVHFTASLMLWFLLHRKWIDAFLVFMESLPGLLFFRVWEGNPVFGYENLPLPRTPGAVLEIAGRYASICMEALGPLWILALVYTGIRAFRGHRGYILPLMLFASGFAIQCLWPLIFTRYAIIFTPWLCPLVGVFFSDVAWSKFTSALQGFGILLMAFLFVVATLPMYLGMPAIPFTLSFAMLILLTGFIPMYSAIAEATARTPNRLSLFSALAVAATLLLHGTMQLLYTRENLRSYANYERTIWQTAVYAEKLRKENPNAKIVVYTDFVAEHFNRLLSILEIAPAVTLRPYPAGGLTRLEASERLLIWNQDDNFPSFLPPRAALGLFVSELATATTSATRIDKSVTIPLAIPAGATITHLFVNADPAGWPRAADLDIQLAEGGASVALGTIRGANLTRPFMGPQKLLLDQPLVLADAATAITLTARNAPPKKSPQLNTKSFSENTPTISVWGSLDSKPFQKISGYTTDSSAPVIYAPSYLLQTALWNRQLPDKTRLPGFVRTMDHKYGIELYGPSADHRR